jgi:ribonuclease HI
MHVHDVGEMESRTEVLATGARTTQLHPHAPKEDAMLAVDLIEIDPGLSTPPAAHEEEHVLFVLSGSGEVTGAVEAGSSISMRPNSVVHIGHREMHSLHNTGNEVLRVLMSTPLIVRSERALRIVGHGPFPGATTSAPTEQLRSPGSPEPPPAAAPAAAEKPAPPKASAEYPASGARSGKDGASVAESPAAEPEEPAPDISGLVKKASEVAAAPRSERKRPQPEPEPEPEAEAEAEKAPVQGAPGQAEEDAADHVMELYVVFDGGSRGNPGQGYGSFMVQSPNRKPVIKRLEFGDNYTNNQAEYDSLIGALQYIIERLEATNRSPEQVELDIKSDSDLVVNQLLGAYKVKDAGLKARHAQAIELLDRFAAWMINWHARTESVRLLGH